MIWQHGFFTTTCDNVGCKNGEELSPAVYVNKEEMRYREYVRHIEQMGWKVLGATSREARAFCPICAKNKREYTIMKY